MSSFFCSVDPDIELFLKDKSVKYEKVQKSCTYLIFDEDTLASDTYSVLGYFTLALHTISVSDETSTNLRKKLDGVCGTRRGEKIKTFPCFLIGQLARNENIPKDTLSGKYILDQALAYISTAQDVVGGRIVLIECKQTRELISFYENNDFSVIEETKDTEGNPMMQMIRRIGETVK